MDEIDLVHNSWNILHSCVFNPNIHANGSLQKHMRYCMKVLMRPFGTNHQSQLPVLNAQSCDDNWSAALGS